jgi:hypothetical protein
VGDASDSEDSENDSDSSSDEDYNSGLDMYGSIGNGDDNGMRV